ncbi:MAG TPA: hypothetical protein VGG57_00105 [Stellaceae bacterium]|jgi:hypothetical protein
MPRLTLLLLAVVAACSNTQAAPGEARVAIPMQGWRTAGGAVPSQAEFSALAATCQARGGALDSCLGDMGLRRSP